MIERQKIDNRWATIAYLSGDLTPWPNRDAPIVKLIFDDGEVVFLSGKEKENGAVRH